MREVRKRATVTGSMPLEAMPVASAGANVSEDGEAEGGWDGAQGGGSRAEVDALLGPRTDPSGVFQNMSNLKRAFLFFDRQGKHSISVDELHATLAELGHVDAPSSTLRASLAAGGRGGGEAEGSSELALGVSAPPPPQQQRSGG